MLTPLQHCYFRNDKKKHSYSLKLLSPERIPALSRVCSSLHHCSSRLLCLTVHSWHGWAHPRPPLLRHARRIGGHAAHVSRKWSALHPSWWHPSQGHGTTRLAWPLSMHLTVGIYTHARSWATVTCVGHAAVRWWSGVVSWTKWQKTQRKTSYFWANVSIEEASSHRTYTCELKWTLLASKSEQLLHHDDRQWNKLPKELVQTPSLEIFELDNSMSNLLWSSIWPWFEYKVSQEQFLSTLTTSVTLWTWFSCTLEHFLPILCHGMRGKIEKHSLQRVNNIAESTKPPYAVKRYMACKKPIT